jgi:hypothetical protein
LEQSKPYGTVLQLNWALLTTRQNVGIFFFFNEDNRCRKNGTPDSASGAE